MIQTFLLPFAAGVEDEAGVMIYLSSFLQAISLPQIQVEWKIISRYSLWTNARRPLDLAFSLKFILTCWRWNLFVFFKMPHIPLDFTGIRRIAENSPVHKLHHLTFHHSDTAESVEQIRSLRLSGLLFELAFVHNNHVFIGKHGKRLLFMKTLVDK